MERHEILALMGELALVGMRHAPIADCARYDNLRRTI